MINKILYFYWGVELKMVIEIFFKYKGTYIMVVPSPLWIIHIICTYFCTDQDAHPPDIIAEDLRPSQPRKSSNTESQKAFDVFRPPGYQKSVHSGDSHQRLLSEVHEGVVVGNQPLPMDSDHTVPEDAEKDIAKQMWLEAVDDLKKDNKRQQRQLQEEQVQEKEANFDMSDVFCLFPCCCCCFCICRKPRKKGIRKK